MSITLTTEQIAWLDVRVAAGEFSSIEQAVHHFINDRMSDDTGDPGDLEWVKPLLDEARDAVARGEVVTREAHRAHTAILLGRLSV